MELGGFEKTKDRERDCINNLEDFRVKKGRESSNHDKWKLKEQHIWIHPIVVFEVPWGIWCCTLAEWSRIQMSD